MSRSQKEMPMAHGITLCNEVEPSKAGLALRPMPMLGSYAGGAAFKLCPVLASYRIHSKESEKFVCQLVESAKASHTAVMKWPEEERAGMLGGGLPASFPASFAEEISVERFIVVCSHCGECKLNVMLQGWLHNEIDKERLGATAWPLVGLLEEKAVNMKPGGNFPGVSGAFSETEAIGVFSSEKLQGLKPSDQHVHKTVEVLNLDGFEINMEDWNYGSDMSRIQTAPANSASGIVVSVDLASNRVCLAYFLVLPVGDPSDAAKVAFEGIGCGLVELAASRTGVGGVGEDAAGVGGKAAAAAAGAGAAAVAAGGGGPAAPAPAKGGTRLADIVKALNSLADGAASRLAAELSLQKEIT